MHRPLIHTPFIRLHVPLSCVNGKPSLVLSFLLVRVAVVAVVVAAVVVEVEVVVVVTCYYDC